MHHHHHNHHRRQVRAEDGRAVGACDIAAFINNLPGGRDTRDFSTRDASGSTSQAANIVEALEAGASALFIDEDTCVCAGCCRRSAPLRSRAAATTVTPRWGVTGEESRRRP
jgi:hypothetical protein